ncbi:MAG: polysaccharide biosynthesis protein [Phycisphaerales bacterium]|nr:polysaccharide biosynthesis protein [Phycisphaerales bacterium]
MSRTARAISGTVTGGAAWLIQVVMAAAVAPVVLRCAGQEVLGTYAILMQVIGYSALLDLGIGAGMSRYLPQAFGSDDGGHRFRSVMASGRMFQLATNLLSAASIAIMTVFVERWFKLSPAIAGQARLALVILAAWTVVRSPWSLAPSALLAVQDLSFPSIAALAANALRLGLTLFALIKGFGLVGITVANVLAEVALTGACAVRFHKLFPQFRPEWGAPDKKLLKELVSYGGHLAVINLAVRLCLFTDNLVVGSLFGAAAVSVYYSTQLIGSQLWVIITRLPDFSSPAINELYARHESHRLGAIMLRLHRYNLLIVLPAAVGLIAFNGPTVRLWLGPGQYAGMLLTASLAGFIVLMCIGHVAFIFVAAVGRMRVTSTLAVAEGVINLGLSIWLGRRMGVQGVMLATLLANLPTTAYMVWFAAKEFRVTVPEALQSLVRGTAPAVLSGVGVLVILRLNPPTDWSALIGDAAAFGVLHCAAAALIGVTKGERASLLRGAAARRSLANIAAE